MDKQHFLGLLYLLGISPILFAISSSLTDTQPFLIFGVFNIVMLLLFALLFSKASFQKKSIWLAVVGGLLLLGVVVWGLYNLWSGASDWLYNKVLAPETKTTTDDSLPDTSLTWDLLSGNSLSGTNLSGNTLSGETMSGDTTPEYTGNILTPSLSEATTDTFDTQPEQKPATEPKVTTVLPSQWTLNYAQVIPYLVDKYKLKNTSGKTFTFTNVSKSNVLYTPFNIAASKAMIGENISPASKVSCNTYLVLKGIAAWWKVSYTGAPQAAYRAKAVELWQTNGCKDGAFVTKATL